MNTEDLKDQENDNTQSKEAETTESETTQQEQADDVAQENSENVSDEADAPDTNDTEVDEVEKLKQELGESKDKYLRLYSDFENFRRRTAKERIELSKTANKDLMVTLLSVLDDFDRAKKSIGDDPQEVAPVKEGFDITYKKLFKALEGKGLKEMEDAKGKDFDTEFHEAVTQFPAPSEDMKGKVIDVVEKGYMLDDKVIRFAKVVVGM